MSSDLISVISKCINDFEEKHSPIVISFTEYHETIIEFVREDRYKWTNSTFIDPDTREIRKQTIKYTTKKGLLMYYAEDLKQHEADFDISCGMYSTVIFKGEYADSYEEESEEFVQACFQKVEWCLEFQKECFE